MTERHRPGMGTLTSDSPVWDEPCPFCHRAIKECACVRRQAEDRLIERWTDYLERTPKALELLALLAEQDWDDKAVGYLVRIVERGAAKL